MDDRTGCIEFKGKKYDLIFTVMALKEITDTYGGFEEIIRKLSFEDTGEGGYEAAKTVVFLITLLVNQGIAVKNYNCSLSEEFLTEQDIALLIDPENILHYCSGITDAINKGVKTHIKSGGKYNWENTSRESSNEAFARLVFFGVTLLNRCEQEVWLMPVGSLLDQIEIYKQLNGLSKPYKEVTIDDIIPF